ncbi:MAG: helix-turn-helix domain-containing protein [Myxococcota bacterium]
MLNATKRRALRILFDFARDDQPADLALVAAALGATCAATDRLLEELARAGFVDADRVRLTMMGLTVAVSTPATVPATTTTTASPRPSRISAA